MWGLSSVACFFSEWKIGVWRIDLQDVFSGNELLHHLFLQVIYSIKCFWSMEQATRASSSRAKNIRPTSFCIGFVLVPQVPVFDGSPHIELIDELTLELRIFREISVYLFKIRLLYSIATRGHLLKSPRCLIPLRQETADTIVTKIITKSICWEFSPITCRSIITESMIG